MWQPYSYLIGWTTANLWYYGVRYGKNCHPTDLWITYFTSSKRVGEIRTTLGEPDVLEIRKVFNNKKDALNWEAKVLRRVNAAQNAHWLNKSNGNCNFYVTSGYKHTQKTRERMSAAHKGKKCPSSRKSYSTKIARYGKEKHTETSRLGGLARAAIGYKHTPEIIQKIKNNSVLTENQRSKISKANTGQKWYNNGTREILIKPHQEVPHGFELGRCR